MFSSLSSFASSGRVALVIGNSAYKQVAALQNPGNDATAIGAALQRMGFEVTVVHDATKVEFDSALSTFSDAANGADIAIVFYAGHGIELEGTNYLIPTDATLSTDAKVTFETVTLDDVLDAVRGVKGLRVVLLDACRENPFVPKMKRNGATRSIGRGLARIEPTPNLLVSYSAEAGAIADDGDSDHSPYTEGLLKFMEMPDLEVNFLFRRVSAYVRNKTDGRQTPFEYSRLPENPIYLSSPPATSLSATNSRLFLYEERIGAMPPTAVAGSVAWSIDMQTDAKGRSDPIVKGNVTVPERNLSALMTFRRNSDPSLPASHLVEIVFSVPPNFEGGSIDSVQRISMKRTEQDRGDALIAVPAKITDDFHMIALNDYPDARKANLDLMATRNWLDIPITYRNGRRALLTLEKGRDGEHVFSQAIQAWTSNALALTDDGNAQ
ncbi:caspase family protein [Rhizobium leguminosarum]|nr:caspase family protein [Rhizobium leguminosarum]MBY2920469.1 caspase family protein [Rhizobium leguminosarum]MBY3020404.1 caspase family protein [Rhizobium leguminosarum]MBY3047777.1 caspase family protein [Rhizobium leguminosarum]